MIILIEEKFSIMTFFETKYMLGQPRWVYLLGNKFLQ